MCDEGEVGGVVGGDWVVVEVVGMVMVVASVALSSPPHARNLLFLPSSPHEFPFSPLPLPLFSLPLTPPSPHPIPFGGLMFGQEAEQTLFFIRVLFHQIMQIIARGELFTGLTRVCVVWLCSCACMCVYVCGFNCVCLGVYCMHVCVCVIVWQCNVVVPVTRHTSIN